MILGIDPGLSGGLAWLSRSGSVLEVAVMPTRSCDGKKEFDLDALTNLLQKYPKIDRCGLEKAQPMPGQGTVSMFNYGQGFGLLRGLLFAAAIPVELIPPVTWTKAMHRGENPKNHPKVKSLHVVERLFPNTSLIAKRGRTPHEGIVDALLLAEFTRRRLLDECRTAG